MDFSNVPRIPLQLMRPVLVFLLSIFALPFIWSIEQDVIIPSGTIDETVMKVASKTITTESGVVIANGADVLFVAGDRIVLNPGFSVESGANFTATVGQMGDRTLDSEEDWSGTTYLGDTLTIESGGDLHIDEDCTLVFFPRASIVVEGELVIEEGTGFDQLNLQ